jgi:hypothetical protein
MNMTTTIRTMSLWLIALVLMASLNTMTVLAAAPALQGQITLRPLTPQNIKDFGLANAQSASGLSTIGLGQPAYFEVLVNNAVPNADITNVTWVLTGKPTGSSAALAESPLGASVPTFKMADRINQSGAPVFKVAGRTILRPDLRGKYTVTASIQTASSGSTNLTQSITAGVYMGVNTCALCHSGGVIAPNMMTPWSQTLHASVLTRGINGESGAGYNAENIPFHSVGFDANANAVNGGFDDVALQTAWTFPLTLNTNNWNAIPSPLKNLANVQCESCHGPGSEHAFSLGDTNLISKSFIAGNCAQCHDNKDPISSPGIKMAEWNNSLHSHSTRTPSGANRDNCVRCHTAPGFRNFVEFGGKTAYVTNTVYEAITCAACHDPHDATHPHQLRAANTYTLPEGTTVTNVGSGALCMTCHHSRNGEVTQNITNYKLGLPTWANGSSFGVHDSTAGDMVEGVNAFTYGKEIPSGSHNAVIPNVCVGCHMQPVAPDHPAFTKAGGHTFSMTYPVVSGGVTNTVDLVNVCVKCHGPIQEFNFARKDYDGDGIIDGVQTEVQHLLEKLSRLLPNSTYRADGNYIGDGLVKSPSVKTNWPTKFLQAAWNWQFVNVEGSKGVHNAPYAVGVLKASIADLTGDSNNDGLADSWQIQYFGSATSTNAALNASPAGDGIPNWLKFALGLDPTQAGISVPGGVVWANGQTLAGTPENGLAIYTAAEVVFDTVVGTSYQIEAISNLGGGWQKIGSPIAGAGNTISYVTPTRTGVQQFYRVTHTP